MSVQQRGVYIPNPDVQPGKAGQSNQQARENQFYGGEFRVQSGRHGRNVFPSPDAYIDWHDGANLLSSNGIDQWSPAIIGRSGVIESGNRQAAGGLSAQQIAGGELGSERSGFSGRFSEDDVNLGYGIGPFGFGGYGV